MKYITKHPYCFCILLILLLLGWYQVLQQIPAEHCYLLHTSLDDRIPFCPWFLIPYVLWYIYFYGMLFLFLILKEQKSFYRYVALLSIGLTICLLICTLFPCITDVRPSVSKDATGILAVIRFLYTIDKPAVIFPSMHAFGAVAAHHAVVSCPRLRRWRIPSFLLMISIITSTCLIKQHSVVDAIAGTLIGILLCRLLPRFEAILFRHFSPNVNITDEMNNRR